MLIASLVTSCLALFLHAGTCPEGSLPGLSSVQPEVQSSGFQVRFRVANEQQPEDGPRERGMRNGPGGPEGRGGGHPMADRVQGDHGPDVQHLLQRIEQLEQQLQARQGPGRGERVKGGPPAREDKREDNRGQKRGEKKGGMQDHHNGPERGARGGRQAGPQGGPFGGMGGRGMGGGPEMFERRGEMMEQMHGAIRERIGQHLPEIRERVGQRLPEIRERIIERVGPGGPEGRGGPREEIRIERRGGPDRGPAAEGSGGPNEHRIPKEGFEIRVEEHRDANAGPQSATDPRLERILHMVERLNERLDRLEKQASHGEAPMPQDRPGDAPRPRGPQGGGRGGPEAGSGGGR